jgi:D-sedoheptulose 7-phosphate isomerase
MNKIDFYSKYYDLLYRKLCEVDHNDLYEVASIIRHSSDKKGKIIIIGNGGSAAIASHVSIDLLKAANITAINFNESSLLTCFSNDYGYEHWVERAIECYANSNDVVILISSSGESQNIINGAKKVNSLNIPLIALSGFSKNNSLNGMGAVNLWIDSSGYNIVESVHQIWLLSIVDYLIENK